MTIRLPGFPEAVSGPVELPDIGELLVSPAFQNISADCFLKYATDFQRDLFGKIPLRNDKKYVIVRSGVWLLEPDTRSHVQGYGNWHIDGDTDFDHQTPQHRVFILSSQCASLTEFNTRPLDIEALSEENRFEFAARVARRPDDYKIAGAPIKPCHIYMFDNHLHRAVNPTKIEFRYFLRVRESNIPDIQISRPLRQVFISDVKTSRRRQHVVYHPDRVEIYYPGTIKKDVFRDLE